MFVYGNYDTCIGSSNATTRVLRTFSNSLNSYQANVFDSKHLAGASSDLVRSMVKVGRKAAELEQVKLQTEIIKEQSKLSTSEPLEGSVYICK